jgi:DNA-binding PadR family transcriptional regulator
MPHTLKPGAEHLPLKAVPHLVLLLLAEAPSYGVELLQRLDEASDGGVRLNAGSLYRTISQLVDEGLVEPTEEVKSAGRGAPRKLYGVTERGRSALRAEAERQARLLRRARSLDLLGDA